MKTAKRWIGAVLALCLVAGLLPVTAGAHDMGKMGQGQTVSAGFGHTLAIQTDGSLWACGSNNSGQLGIGTFDYDHHLTPVKVMDNVAAVSAGAHHSLAIQADGSLWAWGDNLHGQLGDGTTTDRHTPVKVMDNVAAVSAGDIHSLAIQADGSLWAWGVNYDGQLGDGTTENRHTPVKVMDNVAAACAGEYHSLAIQTDGSLWAWGANYYGQLGDGTTTERHTPVKVMDNVAAVSAGDIHSLAIQADGSLWAWGVNYDGQLGDGTTENRHTPVKIMDNVAAVSAGLYYSLAIQTDGSLWAWGANYYGQLGDGTTENRHTPVKVMDNVVAVSAGDIHSLAIQADGSLWAWGYNFYGQLGDGTTTERHTPVKIMDNVALPEQSSGQESPGSSAEKKIAVYSTNKSLTIQTGGTMRLGFGELIDQTPVGNWKRMAVVVSDPTVISLSDYEQEQDEYYLTVTGEKPGATNVTVTDTDSGASITIVVTVRDTYVDTYSYAIDNMRSFFPNNDWENHIQTNVYDLNGLYINNYACKKNGANYTVSFDAYNSRYHTGAVDIYDASGNWINSEEIGKYQMISGLWDTGEQAFYLISDAATGKLLTYEQASFSKHTAISFEVPDGGYFVISNNFAQSPGTFLFNSCDILFSGICTLIDAGTEEVKASAFSKSVKEKITKDKTLREAFMESFKSTAESEIRTYVKNLNKGRITDAYSDTLNLFEDVLEPLKVDWKDLAESSVDIGESIFEKMTGPVGTVLEGCFAFSKGSNQLLQATHLAASVDAPYATVYSSLGEGVSVNSSGIVVDTNGNVDAETELHVFRVSNNDTIEVVLDGSGNPLEKYELYNICFVKNDQLVQPNGKVTVRIPIPEGMRGDTCNVYRQEADGSWTILFAHLEGNYLVFETDHFSLYGIVGRAGTLTVSTLPQKMTYQVGDALDINGLSLSLDGEPISSGFVCSPSILSNVGTQAVTVRYGSASTHFNVTVEKAEDSDPSTPPSSSGGSSSGSGSGGSSSGAGGGGGSGSSGGGSSSSSGNTQVNVTVTTWQNPYADVSGGAWYYDAVRYVTEQGLMSGYGDGMFGPGDALSRSQLAQILYNDAGRPTATLCDFSDVSLDAWYLPAVAWSVEQNILTGYGDGRFGPEDPITREQLAVILWRYVGRPSARGTLESFPDADEAGAWALEGLQWAVGQGVLTGKGNGALDPLGPATRAEVATVLARCADLVK